MSDKEMLPEIMVFEGSNGSGKSTITRMAKTVGIYINEEKRFFVSKEKIKIRKQVV